MPTPLDADYLRAIAEATTPYDAEAENAIGLLPRVIKNKTTTPLDAENTREAWAVRAYAAATLRCKARDLARRSDVFND